NSFRDVVYARAVDGTNASPYVSIRVLSFAPDADSDGLPDTWMTNYFGNANPNIGSNHHASDDFDGDGFSNLREFLLGTDPTNKNSNLHFTSTTLSQLQWEAKGYELYELHSSTNLSTWTRRLSPIIPLTSVGSVSNISDLSPKQFFRVIKVP
ncbi:MAG: hypothetical protein JWM68_4633, partial [Verrucomicrobiales bacterium]|nr:hypothetical protein [Verrucomicrobiales bacterium]